MFHQCRIRRILKWTGTVVSILLLIVWVLSSYWMLICGTKFIPGRIVIFNGTLQLDGYWFPNKLLTVYLHQKRSGLGFDWLQTYVDFGVRFVKVPLWMIFGACAIPTSYMWWRERPQRLPGHCQACGYDLTGNVSGICPECGKAIVEKSGADC